MKKYQGNQSIRAIKATKPHIVFIDRYWRVSPVPRPYNRYRGIWDRAHARAIYLNQKTHG